MTKTDRTYARFEAFEEQLAHCYFLLHERFIANPPLAKFWADSAMEELEHFSMLRFCREKGLTAEVELDIEAADHIEQLLEMTKSIVNEPDVSIDDAFYASLLMESSEIDELLALVMVPCATTPVRVPVSGGLFGRNRLMMTGPAVAPTLVAEPR